MVTLMTIFAGFAVAWLAAEMESQMEDASITADVGRATLRGMEKSWDGIKGGVNSVHYSIHSTVFEQRRPLELPEWTGRERESLRADLEAAERHIKRRREVRGGESGCYQFAIMQDASRNNGLFPEALEAYIEEQE